MPKKNSAPVPAKTISSSEYFSESKTNSYAPSAKATPSPTKQPSIVIDGTHYSTVKVTKKIIGRVEK